MADDKKIKTQEDESRGFRVALLRLIERLIKCTCKSVTPDDVLINRAQATVTIATPTKPSEPDVIASATQTGYDRIIVYHEKQRLSNRIWVINDGPGTLYAITTHNATEWSGEGDILPGESRAFYTVYELRVRSPNALTTYRVTEYEPQLAYDMIVNRSSFTAPSVTNAAASLDFTLPNIAVPNGVSLVVRANVGNAGAVYISAVDATVVASRNTLNPGDVARLYITNANLVHAALAVANDRIDILVEQ